MSRFVFVNWSALSELFQACHAVTGLDLNITAKFYLSHGSFGFDVQMSEETMNSDDSYSDDDEEEELDPRIQVIDI